MTVQCQNHLFETSTFFKYSVKRCKNCSLTLTFKKKDNLTNKLLKFSKLFNLVLNNKILNSLFKELIIDNKPNTDFYKWYHETLDKYEKTKSIKNDKFRELELNEWLKFFNKYNFNFHNKKILFISEEPGFLPKKISEVADVKMTAFDNSVSKKINDVLKIECRTFDINKDNLSNIFNEKFDVCVSLGNKNYCLDNENYLNNLIKIINVDGYLIVDNKSPSLGYLLYWQFHDYISTTFINDDDFESIAKKLKLSVKIKEVKRLNIFKYYLFDYHFNTLASKIRFIIKFIIYLPFRFYYFFKNYYFLSDKLGTTNTIYIFKKLKN